MGRETIRMIVEGPRRCAIAPPSALRAATSRCLRHREDLPGVLPSIEPASLRPPMPPLDHIDSWIFDLDNTLSAPSATLFDLIDERMGAFIMRLLTEIGRASRRERVCPYC